MTKTPISVQDLRRSLYIKAKAESAWRFWGLYVHVCGAADKDVNLVG
jgi:RNA-directed DNA polymerase